jgi:oxygen-dependent protoporphyrinogen oxidase
MVKQPDNAGIVETLYDTVIIGAGIAGLTAAYMLRDKNILLLEEEDRFGGRVLSEKVNEATNNIGTQFFGEEDTSFVHLINELGIERVSHDMNSAPIALYLNNQLYTDFGSLFSLKVVLDAIRFISKMYRKAEIFKLPSDDPRWQKLAKQNVTDLQKGFGPEILALVNTYMRGACVSKPERTSAGMGAALSAEIFKTGDMAFVIGGFQKITDAMVDKLDGKVMNGAGVVKVQENDGILSTHYQKNGKEHIVKSKAAVVAVPPNIALKLLPNLPKWKKEALTKVEYGPITVISVFLKRSIPWKRWWGMISNNVIFQGITDATYDTEEDKNQDNPIIYNFIISIPPDEKREIEAFLAKSDEEILTLTLNDFNRIYPDADIEKYVLDTKVTRFPIGELELSPEYYLELLPHLPKPVGNIHFCGDYTEAGSFVDGAAISGMRVASELGSKFIASEEEIIKWPLEPKWGAYGWATMICNILLIAGGFFLPGGYGTTLSIGAGLLLAFTAAFPYYFPPMKLIYQVLLGITIGFGGIIALLATFIR